MENSDAATTETSNENNSHIHVNHFSPQYELKSVVHHIGSSASSGHYTADVSLTSPSVVEGVLNTAQLHLKNDNTHKNQWMRFDDCTMTSLAWTDVKGEKSQRNAYMLLYEQKRP